MAVTSPTQSPVAAPATTDATALGRARLADNFSTFLSLLTTQLKNQDPLSPLDSNQFTQQLVQMTGVEQQLASNDLLKQLVANTGSGITTAVSLIGKDVRAATSDSQLSNGKADWTYKLDRDAGDVKVEVLNAKGAIVHTEAATENKAGDHDFSWNGKDATGAKLPDGAYTLRVTAKDSTGTAVTSTTFVQGRVTGVEQLDGATYITLNGGKVPWNTVTSVKEPPATSTAADTIPTPTTTPAATT
ncbi:MAG: flgD [Phenylobacterium sp.]|nr:flgD [Phenylobacterium sp.]